MAWLGKVDLTSQCRVKRVMRGSWLHLTSYQGLSIVGYCLDLGFSSSLAPRALLISMVPMLLVARLAELRFVQRDQGGFTCRKGRSLTLGFRLELGARAGEEPWRRQ